MKPPAYSPPAGTASGIPGASYPVMGSAPITNMQPRYSTPGEAQLRPGVGQPPMGGSLPPLNQGQQPPVGNRPQMLANALGQMGSSGAPRPIQRAVM